MVENLSKIWTTGRFDSLNSSPSWWNSDSIISTNWIDNLKFNAFFQKSLILFWFELIQTSKNKTRKNFNYDVVENLSKIWATGRFDSLNSSPSWWNSDSIISTNWIDNLKFNAFFQKSLILFWFKLIQTSKNKTRKKF